MKKWLKYTLGILLTLIALAAVGLAGYKTGRMQSVSLIRKEFLANAPAMQNLPNHNQGPQGNAPMPERRDEMKQHGNRGFEHKRGGFSIFPAFFGLIQALILGAVVWLGYQIAQRSGWKLVREPLAHKTQSAESKEENISE